jgi:hypothetical protein
LQFIASVCKFASHPFAKAASQFANPDAHAIAQLFIWHDTVPLGVAPALHARPHEPQLAVVVTSVSQPLAVGSQSAKPATHACVHTPAAHRAIACGASAHGVSHPFVASPSQSEKPVLHTTPHVPALHTAMEFGALGHA